MKEEAVMMDFLMLAALAVGFLLVKCFAGWCVHEVEKK